MRLVKYSIGTLSSVLLLLGTWAQIDSTYFPESHTLRRALRWIGASPNAPLLFIVAGCVALMGFIALVIIAKKHHRQSAILIPNRVHLADPITTSNNSLPTSRPRRISPASPPNEAVNIGEFEWRGVKWRYYMPRIYDEFSGWEALTVTQFRGEVDQRLNELAVTGPFCSRHEVQMDIIEHEYKGNVTSTTFRCPLDTEHELVETGRGYGNVRGLIADLIRAQERPRIVRDYDYATQLLQLLQQPS